MNFQGTPVTAFTLPASPAAGVTVLWKYRAIYLDGDHVFGQWSDTGSIAVTGYAVATRSNQNPRF